MTTSVGALQWKPYQSGSTSSLVAQLTLDPTIDTNFTIPTVSMYQQNLIYADGVIVNNLQNSNDTLVQAGPLLTDIPAFNRSYVLLDKSVGNTVSVMIASGPTGVPVQLTFYKGTPPFNPALVNYGGAVSNPTNPVLDHGDNGLVADINLNVAGAYFQGPAVNTGNPPGSQWLVMATLQFESGAGDDILFARISDGVSIRNVQSQTSFGAFAIVGMTLISLWGTPAGNLGVQVGCNSGSGKLLVHDNNGNPNASVVTVVRLA